MKQHEVNRYLLANTEWELILRSNNLPALGPLVGDLQDDPKVISRLVANIVRHAATASEIPRDLFRMLVSTSFWWVNMWIILLPKAESHSINDMFIPLFFNLKDQIPFVNLIPEIFDEHVIAFELGGQRSNFTHREEPHHQSCCKVQSFI